MSVSLELLAVTLLNGVALGLIYVLIASGLTVIFGVSGILNFAHGAFYMLGAYFGLTILDATGSFWVALILAPLAVGVVGMAVERTTLHYIYDRNPLYQVLLTFGLALMIVEVVKLVWGGRQQIFTTPGLLVGAVQLGPVPYPKYRLFVIGFGVVLSVLVWALYEFTNFGLITRAGAQSQQTVRILGIDISRYFTLVFGLGSALAAAGGLLSAPILSVNPAMGTSILITAFVIVVLGGLGSFRGSVVAALLLGVTQTLGGVFVPDLTGYYMFILLILTLLVRPQGLLGDVEVRRQDTKLTFDEIIPPVSLTERRMLGLVAVLLVYPFVAEAALSSFFVSLATLMFIWAILALSLDFVLGNVGLISFGHAAFFGLGAYITALTVMHVANSFLLGLALAMVVVAVVAWVIGALSIRLVGVYFAMITLAFAQMFHSLSIDLSITGGSNGLRGLSTVQLLGVDISGTFAVYYVSLAFLLGIYAALRHILESPFGRAATAIRESERRMAFLGYDTNKFKRRAFTISGVVGGVAGALLAVYQLFVSPNALFWIVSGDALFVVILGGMGTLFGPVAGAATFVGLEQLLSAEFEQWRLIVGALLVAIVLFAPRGLVSVYGMVETRFRSSPPVAGDQPPGATGGANPADPDRTTAPGVDATDQSEEEST